MQIDNVFSLTENAINYQHGLHRLASELNVIFISYSMAAKC